MVDHLSLITTPIKLFNENQNEISSGTGFNFVSKWGAEEHLFLITNKHVVSSSNIKNTLSSPRYLVFYYHMDKNNPAYVVAMQLPLFDSKGRKLWIEHPNKIIDIAILPITYKLPIDGDLRGINEKWLNTDIVISPADIVTLVGYPRMFFDKKNALPIYKTGHIASEHDYDFNGNPYFLIDISAFAGNSGSPVFYINNGLITTNNGQRIISTQTIKKFLGVYSADMIYKENLPIEELKQDALGVKQNTSLQLGIVWKAKLIKEIIDNTSIEDYRDIAEDVIKTSLFKYKIMSGFEGEI